MMPLLRLAAVTSLVLTTGCSAIFGDTFRDRGNDYLEYEQPQSMPNQDGLQFESALPIPQIEGDLTLAEEFVVPRPDKLDRKSVV